LMLFLTSLFFLQLFITCLSARDTNPFPLKRYQLDLFQNCTFKLHPSALATVFTILRPEGTDSEPRQMSNTISRIVSYLKFLFNNFWNLILIKITYKDAMCISHEMKRSVRNSNRWMWTARKTCNTEFISVIFSFKILKLQLVIRVNLISFVLIIKVKATLRRYSQDSQTFRLIICRTLIPNFTKIEQ
jgi:hypothetical protein